MSPPRQAPFEAPWTVDLTFPYPDGPLTGHGNWIAGSYEPARPYSVSGNEAVAPATLRADAVNSVDFQAIDVAADWDVETTMTYHQSGSRWRGIQFWFGLNGELFYSIDCATTDSPTDKISIQITAVGVSDDSIQVDFQWNAEHRIRWSKRGILLYGYIDDVQVVVTTNTDPIDVPTRDFEMLQDDGGNGAGTAQFSVSRIRARNV